MIILETSKEDIELAKQEITSFIEAKQYENFFLIKDTNIYERFALTNKAYKIICEEINFRNHPLKEVPKTFRFEKKVNPHIVDILKEKGARVELTNPEKIYSVINIGKNYLCELIYENKKDFLKRDPKFRPGFHPGACKAKLARILVNLSGVKKGKIIDPFCGTGGILLEASFLNLEAKGYDLEYPMVEKAKKNIKFYERNSVIVEEKNALKLDEKCDAIVTELPFGKTTVLDGTVNDLLFDFLDVIKSCTDKAVIVVPDGKYKIEGWRITFRREVYIHKSLSKLILVLEK